MTNMMVPQFANMGTVVDPHPKANWDPLSIGPQVFHTIHWGNYKGIHRFHGSLTKPT